MSQTERAPLGAPIPIHEIPDEQGQSIVAVAEDQVRAQKTLTEEERVAMLHNAALNAAASGKLEQAEAGHSDSKQLRDDSSTLTHTAIDYRNVAFDARQQMEQNDASSRTHVKRNLSGYIEVASRLANEDLQHRIGEQVIVTTKENPNAGVMDVSLVDPARNNEDVAQLKASVE